MPSHVPRYCISEPHIGLPPRCNFRRREPCRSQVAHDFRSGEKMNPATPPPPPDPATPPTPPDPATPPPPTDPATPPPPPDPATPPPPPDPATPPPPPDP